MFIDFNINFHWDKGIYFWIGFMSIDVEPIFGIIELNLNAYERFGVVLLGTPLRAMLNVSTDGVWDLFWIRIRRKYDRKRVVWFPDFNKIPDDIGL